MPRLYPFPLLALLFFFKSGRPCIWHSFPLPSREPALFGLLSMRNKTGHLFPSPFPGEANPMLWNSDFRGVMSHNDQTKLQKAQQTWPASSFLQMQRVASAAKQGGAVLEPYKRLESHGRVGEAVWLFCSRRTRRMEVKGYSWSSFSHWLLCLKICHFLGKPRNGEYLLGKFSRIDTRSFWTPRCTVNKCKL